jgi:hypothetical protein
MYPFKAEVHANNIRILSPFRKENKAYLHYKDQLSNAGNNRSLFWVSLTHSVALQPWRAQAAANTVS